jgi:hypothetical protein
MGPGDGWGITGSAGILPARLAPLLTKEGCGFSRGVVLCVRFHDFGGNRASSYNGAVFIPPRENHPVSRSGCHPSFVRRGASPNLERGHPARPYSTRIYVRPEEPTLQPRAPAFPASFGSSSFSWSLPPGEPIKVGTPSGFFQISPFSSSFSVLAASKVCIILSSKHHHYAETC